MAPALRQRPLVVAPPGAERATVLALSPEAEAAGIRKGTAVRLARKLCPDLVVIPPNPRLYARVSRALHEVLARYATGHRTPMCTVTPFSTAPGRSGCSAPP